jgi:hypothetical protein
MAKGTRCNDEKNGGEKIVAKTYTCDRCGKKTDDAFNITKWFNGAPNIETVCKECILKIGKEDGEEERS